MTAYDTTIKPPPERQLVITLGNGIRSAFIVEDGKVVTDGFTCEAKRMGTLQVDFLVDALARVKAGKEE